MWVLSGRRIPWEPPGLGEGPARPTGRAAKAGSLPVPDIETAPDPGLREEGPSPLLCSMGGKKGIKGPWS